MRPLAVRPLFVRSLAVAFALILAACGNRAGDVAAAKTPVMRTVHGAVVKGPLVGAAVSFFHVDIGGNPIGPAIATATTDAQGHVTTGLPQVAEPILAVTSGGSYVDESDDAGGDLRRRITLAAGQGFEAIVPANANTFVLTPYSMAILVRARRLSGGFNFPVVYEAVRQQAIAVLGFDPTAVIPADPLAPDAGGDKAYGLLLGGAAYAIGTIATNLGTTPNYAIVRAFIDDLSDGVVDGKVDDSDVQLKVQSIGDVDLNGEIVRFRNNHFRLYDGVPMVEIDEVVWSVDPSVPPVSPPVAASDAIEVAQGGTATALVGGAASVLANDSDPQNAPLTAILVTPPAHGTLALNSDGTFTYVHDGSATTSDQFTYKAHNGPQDSLPAVVAITITSANQPPVAVQDDFVAQQDQDLIVGQPGVLFNDVDPDGPALAAELVDPPAHGSVSLQANGSFSYSPVPGFTGLDSFTYRVTDGAGGVSDVATVEIQVEAAGGGPIARDDHYQVASNGQLSVAAPGVLINDNAQGPLQAVLVTPPSDGFLSLAPNGGFDYTPPSGFSGNVTFQYRNHGPSGDSNTATVHISVRAGAGNHAPVGASDSYTTVNNALAVAAPGVMANDFDPDGDPLTAQLATSTTQGTLTFHPDGSFEYVFGVGAAKVAAKCGCQDHFSYTITDGKATTGPIAVTINIPGLGNQPPTGTNDSYTVDFGGALTVAAPGVLVNDSDPDGDPLTAQKVSDPSQGTLALNADGSFTYQHVPPPSKALAKAALQDSFTYRVGDGSLTSSDVTVTIAINRAPFGLSDSYTLDQGGTLNVAAASGVLANDGDFDGDPITAQKVSDPALGTLTLNANGSFTYQNTSPGVQDSFTYRVSDGRLQSGNVTVTLTLNHAPVAVDDPGYVVDVGGTLTIAAPGVMANDTDPENDALTAQKVSDPKLGTVTVNADGSFTYVNTTDGTDDSFTYRVSDGSLQSGAATVSIKINHPPVAVADSYTADPDRPIAVPANDSCLGALDNLLANDTDSDGDTLTTILDTAPTMGTLVLNADGTFLYQAFSAVDGFSSPPDKFSYHVNDGTADSAAVDVTIDFTNPDCSTPPGARHSPVLTADGQTVVFLSSDQSLVPGKTTTVDDIFVTTFNAAILARTSQAKASVNGGSTIRLMGLDATANDGDVTTGAEPQGDVVDVNVTPDGHYVVFTTFAKEYGLSTAGFSSQVYRYSLMAPDAGEIVLVSSKDGAPAASNGVFNNYSPGGPVISVSDDGQFVAFHSDATDLTADTIVATPQVYLRDITNTQTTLVSVAACGGAGSGSSYVSSISADGSLISFESDAADLTGGCAKAAKALTNTQTFVRDLGAGSTFAASVDSLSTYGNGNSVHSRLSPDGSLIALETYARNLVANDTADPSFTEVIVHNLSNAAAGVAIGDNLRISRAFDGGAPDGSSHLALNPFSLDNAFLTFASDATDLLDATSDTNNVQDVFVYGLNTDAMARVDVDADGNQAVDGSHNREGTISRDGAKIGFTSDAINLDDPTGFTQIYVVDNPLFATAKRISARRPPLR